MEADNRRAILYCFLFNACDVVAFMLHAELAAKFRSKNKLQK